jgi:multimeric flavodoxin WrbA
MGICVLVGSNRKNGLSYEICGLLDAYLMRRNAQCHFIYLAEQRIHFCDADNKCENNMCGISDDMPMIVEQMQSADGIIYMPVIHAYGTNSKFQAFLERSGYGYFRPLNRPLQDKLASIIVVGRRYGHTAVYAQIALNIMLNKMIMVGSGFPALFMRMLGKSSDDREAIEALEGMLERMFVIHHRLFNLPSQITQIER